MQHIALVSKSRDHAGVDEVAEHIRAQGARPIRLNTDHYPTGLQLSSRFDAQGQRRWLKLPDGEAVDLDSIDALWYRRFDVGAHLPASLGDRHPHCVSEARRTLLGAIAALPVPQVDRWLDVRAADYKEVQTRRASELGLRQPATLFSNDPQAVRNFYRQLDGKMVTKMQSSFAIMENGAEMVVFTSEVTEQHLAQLDGLRFSPMLFQQAIDKSADVRATVIGERIFTARLDADGSDIDWRRHAEQSTDNWYECTLPEDITPALLKLVRSFGLHYAAADFVIDKQGQWHFLEINAAGEWYWVQLATGQPIAQAIAEHLCQLVGST